MVKFKLVCLLISLIEFLKFRCIYGAPVSKMLSRDAVIAIGRSSEQRVSFADPTVSLKIPELTELEVYNFFKNLGYHEIKNVNRTAKPGSSNHLSLGPSIRTFQREHDLNETGILDDETKLMISAPHCGTSRKRASQGWAPRKWTKTALSYRIKNFPIGKQSEPVRNVITKAFAKWSKLTNLDFREVDDTHADIEIAFSGMVHLLRKERCWFEDPRTLAHAFFPQIGDIHFNSKYFFEAGTTLDDFLDTALHEIGHSLGLEHSPSRASLMFPTKIHQFSEPQPIDIANIQALYGVRKSSNKTTSNNSPPKLCSLKKIDAVLVDDKETTFILAGKYYYIPTEQPPKARLISSKWPGLPANVDAAFRYPDGRSYFFKGTKYWCFSGNRLEAGHPRLISDGFRGLPNNIDATLVDANGYIYAFKGNEYWVYDSFKKQVYPGSPGPISYLRGMTANSIDAAGDNSKGLWIFKGINFFKATMYGFQEYPNGWFQC